MNLKSSSPARILGIDPGSRRTGAAIVETTATGFRHLHHTVIATFDEDFPTRLKDIFLGLKELIAIWQPSECAIETVFFSKNPASVLKLGQARGAAICAAVQADLPVHEYAPRAIKQAVVGGGGADKAQVQYMVGMLLGLGNQTLQADAADALAVALTHAQIRQTAGRLGLPVKMFR